MKAAGWVSSVTPPTTVFRYGAICFWVNAGVTRRTDTYATVIPAVAPR